MLSDNEVVPMELFGCFCSGLLFIRFFFLCLGYAFFEDKPLIIACPMGLGIIQRVFSLPLPVRERRPRCFANSYYLFLGATRASLHRKAMYWVIPRLRKTPARFQLLVERRSNAYV